MNNTMAWRRYSLGRSSFRSVLGRVMNFLDQHPDEGEIFDDDDGVEALRVIIDYKWSQFARQKHLEQMRYDR
jgi:hypothetical protein